MMKRMFCLFFLKSGSGQGTFSLEYETSPGTRRMFDPITSTRKVDLNHFTNREYSRQYKDWSNTSNTGSMNKKRKTRKTPIRGSTTFSKLLHFDPSFASFSNNRYTRQSLSLNKQENILTNIGDKLDLLDLACRMQVCSNQLKRIILQEMERRSSSQNIRNVG